LHNQIDKQSLDYLLGLGLGARCGSVVAEWKQSVGHDTRLREQEKRDAFSAEHWKLDAEMRKLGEAMPFWLVKRAVEHYELVLQDRNKFSF